MACEGCASVTAVPHHLSLTTIAFVESALQGSLLQCQAVAQHRQLPHQYYASADELQARYPINAREGYQGLFEHGAGSIKVWCVLSIGCDCGRDCGQEGCWSLHPVVESGVEVYLICNDQFSVILPHKKVGTQPDFLMSRS